jgi:hypothetical protein
MKLWHIFLGLLVAGCSAANDSPAEPRTDAAVADAVTDTARAAKVVDAAGDVDTAPLFECGQASGSPIGARCTTENESCSTGGMSCRCLSGRWGCTCGGCADAGPP